MKKVSIKNLEGFKNYFSLKGVIFRGWDRLITHQHIFYNTMHPVFTENHPHQNHWAYFFINFNENISNRSFPEISCNLYYGEQDNMDLCT